MLPIKKKLYFYMFIVWRLESGHIRATVVGCSGTRSCDVCLTEISAIFSFFYLFYHFTLFLFYLNDT